MSRRVKNAVIGFGKAGKTLVGFLAQRGEETVLIEQDQGMYGGTCINVGCIPTKKLTWFAEHASWSGLDAETYYRQAVEEKKALIARLNQANYGMVRSKGAEVIDGRASFVDEHRIRIETETGEEEVEAERIFLNTGTRPVLPPVKGLQIGGRIHTSETLLNQERLPKKLVILGGGFIGLEFASNYALFGSEVTILNRSEAILEREEREAAESVRANYEALGVTIVNKADVKELIESEDGVCVRFEIDGAERELEASDVLVAVGRRPNTESLKLENAGVRMTERGFIQVDDHLRTTCPHIFAMGDCNGGPQFTYISLDDFRIVKSTLFGGESYDRSKRAPLPFSAFLYPTLSRVGLTEREARQAGYEVKTACLPVEMIPKAKVVGHTAGIYKAVVDAATNRILGATLYGEESHEVINIVSAVMKAGLPFTSLRDQIFTHPTMAEALNDLFGLIAE